MADTKKTFGYALLQAFGLDDQRVKRLRLDIEAGDVPLLTITVHPRDVSAQQIEAIATEYEIISRSELNDIRERLAALQQVEAERDALRADAELYRWLLEKNGVEVDVIVFGTTHGDLDAAIKAAKGGSND